MQNTRHYRMLENFALLRQKTEKLEHNAGWPRCIQWRYVERSILSVGFRKTILKIERRLSGHKKSEFQMVWTNYQEKVTETQRPLKNFCLVFLRQSRWSGFPTFDWFKMTSRKSTVAGLERQWEQTNVLKKPIIIERFESIKSELFLRWMTGRIAGGAC
jgi:hypothetical protein